MTKNIVQRFANRLSFNKRNIAELVSKQNNSGAVYVGNDTVLTKLYTGQKLYVDTRDTSIAPHLILDGAWEKGMSDLFLKLVRPGDVVIDAGADFGYYGCIAASRLEHSGFVIFAEANPVYKDFLVKNTALNGLADKSYIANNVISDKNGQKVQFRLLEDDWASASAMSDVDFESTRNVDFKVSENIVVLSKTLDQVVKDAKQKKVDVIKMDIEGFEEKAVQGMKSILKNSPNLKLLIEFTPVAYDEPKKLYELLKQSLPYVYVVNIGDGSYKKSLSFKPLSKEQSILLFCKQAMPN